MNMALSEVSDSLSWHMRLFARFSMLRWDLGRLGKVAAVIISILGDGLLWLFPCWQRLSSPPKGVSGFAAFAFIGLIVWFIILKEERDVDGNGLGVRLWTNRRSPGKYRARRELNRGANADHAAKDYARKNERSHAFATAALHEAEAAAERKTMRLNGPIDRFEKRSSLDGLLASPNSLCVKNRRRYQSLRPAADRVSAETLTVPPHTVSSAQCREQKTENSQFVVIPLLGQKGLLLRGSATAAAEVVDAIDHQPSRSARSMSRALIRKISRSAGTR